MQREEKLLEVSVDTLIQRVQEVRNSIASFILKLELEYEALNWPTVLDSFALLSGQISMLSRIMKSDKCPALRNQILLPLSLIQDRDVDLEKLTEGRLACFNHEVVPDYLRTKPEPEVEEKIIQLNTRLNNTTADLQKQLNLMNKVSNNLVEQIQAKKDEWESEMNQKQQQPQTSSQADTIAVLSAITNGASLRRRQEIPQPQQQMQHSAPPGYHQTVHGHHYYQHVNPNQQHQVKAPNTIKTNIRAASSVHPYSRP